MRESIENAVPYLEEYHQRSSPDARFAAENKMSGCNVAQKSDDRIYNSIPHPRPSQILSI